MDAGKCKWCGADVLWTKMEKSGKANPLNPTLITIPPDQPEKSMVVVLENGMAEQRLTREGRTSHWVDCPKRHEHQKEKKAAKKQAEGEAGAS